MQIDDKARIIVPDPLPPPMNKYGANWRNWIVTMHEKTVILRRRSLMNSASSSQQGWNVRFDLKNPNAMRPKNGCSPWVPESWLQIVPPFIGLCDTCGGFHQHEPHCTALGAQ